MTNGVSIRQDSKIGRKGRNGNQYDSNKQSEFGAKFHLLENDSRGLLSLRNSRGRATSPAVYIASIVALTGLPITCSIAAATPFSLLFRVTAQPRFLNSSDAFPMINGLPANASI